MISVDGIRSLLSECSLASKRELLGIWIAQRHTIPPRAIQQEYDVEFKKKSGLYPRLQKLDFTPYVINFDEVKSLVLVLRRYS